MYIYIYIYKINETERNSNQNSKLDSNFVPCVLNYLFLKSFVGSRFVAQAQKIKDMSPIQ